MAEIHSKKIDERKFASIIQKDLVINGDVCFTKDVLVKGKIVGELDCKEDLILMESSEVRGNISAAKVRLRGKVIGDVHSSSEVCLESMAHITGDVSTPKIQIESGCVFEGMSRMNPNAKASH